MLHCRRSSAMQDQLEVCGNFKFHRVGTAISVDAFMVDLSHGHYSGHSHAVTDTLRNA